MEIVDQIGSYAGLAAVVGLAVLSALYFSQARDVRRLREWAGRAPERTASQETAARAPTAPPTAPPSVPVPGARPAATPPAQPGRPAPAPGNTDPQAAPAAPGAQTGVPQGAPRPQQPAAVPAAAGAQSATVAQRPGASPNVAEAPGSETTPPIPPWSHGGLGPRPGARPNGIGPLPQGVTLPWYRRLIQNPRYLVLAVAGVLIVGGGAAFGVVKLAEEGAPSSETTGNGSEADDSTDRGTPVNPSTITVSVLNGTTVAGLAAQIADKVEAERFQLGNVTNSSDQQRAESAVLFAAGAEREAVLVARRLGLSQRERIDPESQALGGDASVVVVVGNDQTQ